MGIVALAKRSALVAIALGGVATVPAQGNDFIFRTAPLATPRAFGGSAVMGDFYYYFGGSRSTAPGGEEVPTNSVIRARVYPDGKLGPWEETTPLPEPRHYIDASTLVLNDVVYVIGGSSKSEQGERYNTAVFSRPLSNGTLLPWSVSQPFGEGEGLSSMAAVSTPGHVHVIGGLQRPAGVSAAVWTNAIYADGSMGPWFQGPTLPTPLWYHSSGAASGRVYVWGGLPTTGNETVSGRVLSAPILGSGKLGDWRVEQSTLPKPFYGATSAVAGNFLLSFSPRYAGAAVGEEAWYAIVTPTGLSPWRARQVAVPNKRFHSSAPDYRRGLIYFGGGRTAPGDPMLADLWFFQLGGAARQSAEQAWLAHQRAHQNTVSAFTPPTPGEAAAQSTLTYAVASKLPASALPGFKTYGEAQADSVARRQPLVVYFHLDGAQPCIEQLKALAAPEFAALLPDASWAWVETKDNPQLAQQLGVYRVPTWIFYDRTGNEVAAARTVGAKPATELAATLAALR